MRRDGRGHHLDRAGLLAFVLDGAERAERLRRGGASVVYLTDEARKWISRGHVRFALDGETLTVQDVSTNGTGIRPGGSLDDDDRLTLNRDELRPLGPDDVVELYAGVHVGRARMWATGGVSQPASVMAEAPTMAIRTFERR